MITQDFLKMVDRYSANLTLYEKYEFLEQLSNALKKECPESELLDTLYTLNMDLNTTEEEMYRILRAERKRIKI